jgi:hypothetical protein
MVLATTDAASGTWASPVQFQAGGNLGLQITGHAARQGDDSGGWRRYTVRPAEVWCFDSRIDHERHRISIQLLL